MVKIEELEKRFWNKVQKTDTCWQWQGYCDSDGYGRNTGGLYRRLGRSGVHQQAYILSGNNIPQGKILRHTCHNPKCCNPQHLILGTPKDNAQDCIDAGRTLKGIANSQHKLTEQQVIEIKNKLKTGYRIGGKLGREYSVSKTIIHAIKTKKIWKHIDG